VVSGVSVSQGVGTKTVKVIKQTQKEAFPINWCPQRVGTQQNRQRDHTFHQVSNQFVSPASGDTEMESTANSTIVGFQSICFPSEWGLDNLMDDLQEKGMFPINLFPQRVGTLTTLICRTQGVGFQSICFPSEWGPRKLSELKKEQLDRVSNQFVSPASGDGAQGSPPLFQLGFQSICFPSEWGPHIIYVLSNWLPYKSFQSICFPSEWGLSKNLSLKPRTNQLK